MVSRSQRTVDGYRCPATLFGAGQAKRGSSRIVRMDNLLYDTLFLLVAGDLGEDGRRRRHNRFLTAPTCSLQSDRHALESVIGMVPESAVGTSGRNEPESVDGMGRNKWAVCVGISTPRLLCPSYAYPTSGDFGEQ